MGESSNRSGQTYAFMAMTPVTPGQQDALAVYLRGLRVGAPSPLAKLPRTHFGRFLVVADFHNDRAWKQRREEHLDLAYLIFTSNFDGDLESYLDDLCEELAPEAKEIWGRCIGCPQSARGAALKAYLKHNQVNTGIFFAAYGQATVEEVEHGLGLRDQMIEFATTTQGLGAQALQQAFVQAFGSPS